MLKIERLVKVAAVTAVVLMFSGVASAIGLASQYDSDHWVARWNDEFDSKDAAKWTFHGDNVTASGGNLNFAGDGAVEDDTYARSVDMTSHFSGITGLTVTEWIYETRVRVNNNLTQNCWNWDTNGKFRWSNLLSAQTAANAWAVGNIMTSGRSNQYYIDNGIPAGYSEGDPHLGMWSTDYKTGTNYYSWPLHGGAPHGAIDRGVFYTLTMHRKTDATIDFYLDGVKQNVTSVAEIAGGSGLPEKVFLGERSSILENYIDWDYTRVATRVIPGDANLDGLVDVQDFTILKANYGMTVGATWGDGDFGGGVGGAPDGMVDSQDFTILKFYFGDGRDETQAHTPVPEPGIAALLALGVAAILRRKRGLGA